MKKLGIFIVLVVLMALLSGCCGQKTEVKNSNTEVRIEQKWIEETVLEEKVITEKFI